jgi:hypothetical protein
LVENTYKNKFVFKIILEWISILSKCIVQRQYLLFLLLNYSYKKILISKLSKTCKNKNYYYYNFKIWSGSRVERINLNWHFFKWLKRRCFDNFFFKKVNGFFFYPSYDQILSWVAGLPWFFIRLGQVNPSSIFF